jgi:hypothetical protein
MNNMDDMLTTRIPHSRDFGLEGFNLCYGRPLFDSLPFPAQFHSLIGVNYDKDKNVF